MLDIVLVSLEFFGIAVFAVTGALVASRKQMDIFGFMLLGTVTGIGGGSLRDLLLGALPVFWVTDPTYVVLCIVPAALVFFTAHLLGSRYRLLLWLDAVGLAFFCVVGADKVLAAGAGAFIAVIMGVVSATFGGIIRDVLGGESPLVLRREIYVTAALAGAIAYVGLRAFDPTGPAPALAGFLLCLVIRGLALHYHWSLPAYRARPGRSEEELRKMGL
jgi:uncharacterized membrane protein YeiH